MADADADADTDVEALAEAEAEAWAAARGLSVFELLLVGVATEEVEGAPAAD